MNPFYRSLKPLVNHAVLSRPTAWPLVFGNDHPIDLEIGIGNGEYIAQLCQEQPHVNFLGFEQYCERIHRSLRKLSRVPSENVRVFRLDVRAGLAHFIAPQTLRHVYCLYPAPWPKKSDIKHRLLTTDFLKLVNSRLKDNGVFKIVTDHQPYALWIVDNVPGTGFELDFKTIPASYGTKFELKWVEGGQREFYELYLVKREHIDVPLTEDAEMQTYLLDNFDPECFHLPEYTAPGMAIALRDFLYDPKKKTALVHMVVVDDNISQNIRVVIVETPKGWRINLAEGGMFMPTQGVAKALECVHKACGIKN